MDPKPHTMMLIIVIVITTNRASILTTLLSSENISHPGLSVLVESVPFVSRARVNGLAWGKCRISRAQNSLLQFSLGDMLVIAITAMIGNMGI